MMSNIERLAYMADQIVRNFAAIGQDDAVTATADHIASFWDPRMKRQAFAMLDGGGAALSPGAAAAFDLLRTRGAPSAQTRATDYNDAGESGHSDAG